MQHGCRHPELASGLPNGQPLGSEVKGTIDIDDGRRPTTMLSRQSGSVNAGSGTAGDLTALFFGHPTEDGDEQGADWATGIEPGLSDANDLDTKPIEVEDFSSP